jgi:hypothetical protein
MYGGLADTSHTPTFTDIMPNRRLTIKAEHVPGLRDLDYRIEDHGLVENNDPMLVYLPVGFLSELLNECVIPGMLWRETVPHRSNMVLAQPGKVMQGSIGEISAVEASRLVRCKRIMA